MDGIKDKMEKAKQDLKDYEEINGEDDGSELVDIADLMVENQLYLDRIDGMIGKQNDVSENSE